MSKNQDPNLCLSVVHYNSPVMDGRRAAKRSSVDAGFDQHDTRDVLGLYFTFRHRGYSECATTHILWILCMSFKMQYAEM